MDKIKISYLNISASLFQQIISVIFGFVSRMLFIHTLGVEILGLNNTFESVLGTLALADLGIQRAITYSLYKPFHENNHDKINDILNVYKWFYRIVAIFILIGSLICVYFLPYIITGFEFQPVFIIYFLLIVINSASSYLLAYKRILFYVDQKEYITKLIDAGSSFVFLTLKIIVLYFTENYINYLLIQITQTILSNIVVYRLSNERYPYIEKTKVNRQLLRTVWRDMKDVIFGKFASFVYDSTDNLVVSAYISTAMVGLLGNYVLVMSSIKKVINSIVNPFAPIIGRLIAEGENTDKQKSFELCTHFSYLIAMILLVPTFGLINQFIILWIGNHYLLDYSISFLLVTDLFIFTMQGICCTYIFGEGYFKKEKVVDIITAVMNLSISISLVNIIGINGVLIGTLISEGFMWIGRSYIVYFYSINTGKNGYMRYWFVNMIRVITFMISVTVAKYIGCIAFVNLGIVNFIINGILMELFVCVIYFVFFGFTSINKQLISLVLKGLRRSNI